MKRRGYQKLEIYSVSYGNDFYSYWSQFDLSKLYIKFIYNIMLLMDYW